MTIVVKFFGSLREEIGKSEVKLTAEQPLTVAQVWAQACDEAPLHHHIWTAVNMTYVDQNTLVQDGDEVAFFPPVTGGSDEN
ncbi:thiamineS [Thioploca ingrica]|uniref:Molybdopterin synthase sulfur carrier subunit n=1 Tax=Thioploca ingrica TaxID=40754 RepID=A0A090AK92_9GAMM|nr:thiamineS [Thioploca ingrica]